MEAAQREKLERLARYVSRPPVSVGVFAAHAALRAAITPAGRGPGASGRYATAESATPKHVALSWARRLKRVFGIEIEQCVRCGGRLRVVASIEERT